MCESALSRVPRCSRAVSRARAINGRGHVFFQQKSLLPRLGYQCVCACESVCVRGCAALVRVHVFVHTAGSWRLTRGRERQRERRLETATRTAASGRRSATGCRNATRRPSIFRPPSPGPSSSARPRSSSTSRE